MKKYLVYALLAVSTLATSFYGYRWYDHRDDMVIKTGGMEITLRVREQCTNARVIGLSQMLGMPGDYLVTMKAGTVKADGKTTPLCYATQDKLPLGPQTQMIYLVDEDGDNGPLQIGTPGPKL